jgi:hypothetical protein
MFGNKIIRLIRPYQYRTSITKKKAARFRTHTTEAWVRFQRSVCVGFVVDKVALGQVSFRVLWFFRVNTIPPMPNTHLHLSPILHNLSCWLNIQITLLACLNISGRGLNFLASHILHNPGTGECRACWHVAVFRLLYVSGASQSHFRADCTSCEIQWSLSAYRGMTAKSSAWPSNCWLLPSLQQAFARAGLCYNIIKRNRITRTVTMQHNAYYNLAVSSCDQYRKAWFVCIAEM